MNKYILINSLSAVGFFITGYLVKKAVTKKPKIKEMGTLRIDNSDPDEPDMLFLELVKDTKDISDGDYVTFNVSRKNYVHVLTTQ